MEEETANSMFSFVKGTSTWISIPVKMVSAGDVQYKLSIILEKASVTFAHFVISDNVNPRFCAPVSNLIEVNYSETELEITFHDYFEKKIAFLPLKKDCIEIFISQMSLCSTLSTIIVDNFKPENTQFINKFASDDSIFSSARERPIPSVLLPIGDPVAYKTWKKRNTHMNFSYISELQDFKMCFITYNVAQQKPSDECVPEISKIFHGERIDAIFIALEEIDFGAKAVVVGSSDTKNEWSIIFRRVMRRINIDYALVKSCSLGGVYCSVFVRPDLNVHFTVKDPITMRLGVAGLMANKSAIIFPVKISETSISVVAAHLTPHVGHNKERLAQIDLIMKTKPPSDYTLIMGDLNFRILIPYDDAIQYAKEGNVEKIKETDELIASINFTDSMKGFKEPEIKFLPTYKYDLGTDVYDTSPKKRVPAYTDRIIIKTEEPRIAVGPSDEFIFESDVIRAKVEGYTFETPDYFGMDEPKPNYPIEPECLVYSRIECGYSDHRPVYAMYNFKIPVIKEDRVKVLDELMQKKKADALLLCKPIVEATCEDGKIILENKGACWAKWTAVGVSTRVNVGKGTLFPKDAIVIMTTVTGDNPKVTIDIKNGETLELIPINNKLFN